MCLWVSYKKEVGKKIFFCILKVTEERSRIRSWIRSRIHTSRYGLGDPDPDPHQNATDPQHCL